MEFTSHGKSGYEIKILNQDFNYILRKTSKNIKENTRHVERIKKQISFHNESRFSDIKTPKVLHLFEGNNSELAYVDMQYILGKDSLSFLKTANFNEINNFINQLFYYLDARLNTAYENAIFSDYDQSEDDLSEHKNAILNKINEINTNLDFPRKETIIKKLQNLPQDVFLKGKCHGDLTLANMIHANGKLYIFDFLDMYVDTPLLDLISIRQDTYHMWSCFLYNDYNCKIVELLKYIDFELNKRYSTFINNKWYNHLSLMNYVRMYRMYDTTKPCKELDFIYKCITKYI
jgi:hypothetical protein